MTQSTNIGASFRWKIALLVSAAIAISYLDRQTLPVAIKAVQKDIPISNEHFSLLNTAFLITYGLMYAVGGRLLDVVGTRLGFTLCMLFWSLACVSHGFAVSVGMLATSRLLLGVGEGGGFPAATKTVAEWFPVTERSSAMGIINAGTAVGAVAAPPLIALILSQASWRWVFFVTGAFGLFWVITWRMFYFVPDQPSTKPVTPEANPLDSFSWLELLRYRQTWGIVAAKFLSDAAWYFYLFWLPKYLYDARGLDIKAVGAFAWIPYAAAGIGCLCGGGLSSAFTQRLWCRAVGDAGEAVRASEVDLHRGVVPTVRVSRAVGACGHGRRKLRGCIDHRVDCVRPIAVPEVLMLQVDRAANGRALRHLGRVTGASVI